MENIVYLLLILIFLLIFWKIIIKEWFQVFFWYWVPFVRTSDKKIKKLLENLDLKKWQKFLDLWSWDWKVLEEIWNNFEWVELYGIENSYFPYKESIERKEKNNLNYTIYKKDYFKENFWKYDVIYTYMLPYLIKKIWKKINKECKKWTLFYSNSFQIKWVEPIKTIKSETDRYIYVYKI